MEIEKTIKLQRKDNFIRSICCLSDSYYAFLTTDVQLDHIAEFCCAEGCTRHRPHNGRFAHELRSHKQGMYQSIARKTSKYD